tara:strand:- start:69340 stop:69912 length:573 start_codon:yes stop_codon:yes gene_type:complete
MKTLFGKKGLMQIFMLFVLVFSVACGENNTSGKKKTSSGIYPWGNTYGGGVYSGGNGNSLPSNWLDIVAQENPCQFGGQRAQAQMQVQANVNVGALYVGVTSEGDISLVQNQGGIAMMTVYICPRPDLTGQGSITKQPITENSVYCPVGQVSASDVTLQGQYGQYYLKFAPIHIPGTDRISQLCSNGYYY